MQHRTIPLDSNINLPAAIADPETALEESQIRQAIQSAIATLPSNQRQITTLFYIKGYSQNEISDFLELPLTSIKKSLYTARKRLKHRMINMIQDQLQSNKPSRDEAFTNKVKYFLALKAGNLKQVRALIEKDRRLLGVQTEWGVASDGFYWLLGVTGLHWAAITGDQSLLKFFIDQGADPNTQTSSGMAPLHLSVLMRQIESIRLLLASGADVNAKNNNGFTPLHFAILRNKPEIADLLIKNRADLEVADNKGRKPIDWAWLKSLSGLVDLLTGYGARKPDGEISKPPQKPVAQRKLRKVPVGESLLGRVLYARGQLVDDLPPISNLKKQPIYHPAPSPSNWIMETGIKVLDLLTPFKRGGHHCVFTPIPGVGKFVLLAQLIENLVKRYDGYTVCIGLEEAAYTGKSMMLAWRDWGVDERTVNVFSPNNSSAKANLNLVQTGLTIAENFRSQGHEVILLVDSRLALDRAVFNYLKYNTAATPQTAITTVYFGDYSVGAEPDPFNGLDAIVTFNQERASRGLWPAIDPLASRSRLLQSSLVDETHRMVANRVRNLLIRYNDLFPLAEKRGINALTGMQDRQDLLRGGLLQNFLTQPFTGAEPWTSVPGENLDIADTILGCQEILDGKYDALPLESFYLIGTVDQAVEKARNLQFPNLARSSVSPHLEFKANI